MALFGARSSCQERKEPRGKISTIIRQSRESHLREGGGPETVWAECPERRARYAHFARMTEEVKSACLSLQVAGKQSVPFAQQARRTRWKGKTDG
jgi:hypothetical protein